MTETEKKLNEKIDSLENKIDLLVSMLSLGTPKNPDCLITFGEWLDKWLSLYKEKKLKDSTLRNYREYQNTKLIPLLSLKLSALDGIKIQEFLNNIPKNNTRKKVSNLIRASLAKAVKLRMIQFNPYDAVEIPTSKSTHYLPLTFDEQDLMIRSIKNSLYYHIFYILCCAGMRIGEFLALNFVDDINFNDSLIIINKSMDIFTGKISTPKTDTSNRQIPFIEDLVPHLKFIKDYKKKSSLTYNMIRCYFKRIYSKLNLKGLNLHSFRHTFISLCYYVGIREKLIQQFAGHSTLEMTMNTYTHVFKNGTSPLLSYFHKLKEL